MSTFFPKGEIARKWFIVDADGQTLGRLASRVARILSGTGHVNAGLGAVMTIQGIGAALSPALGGYIAERLGLPKSRGTKSRDLFRVEFRNYRHI